MGALDPLAESAKKRGDERITDILSDRDERITDILSDKVEAPAQRAETEDILAQHLAIWRDQQQQQRAMQQQLEPLQAYQYQYWSNGTRRYGR